jgi:AcrR family transcriptional regulator
MSDSLKQPDRLTGDQPARAGRPKSLAIDRAILESTLDVLADVGFDALSLAEVSRRAGGSIPAIYRRYADKRDLVLAALQGELATLPVTVADTGNLRDDLVELARTIATTLTARRARIFASVVLAGRDDPELLTVLAADLHKMGAAHLKEVLVRAARRGERLKPGAASEVIAGVPGAYILGISLLEGCPPDMRQLEALIDAVFLPALLAS